MGRLRSSGKHRLAQAQVGTQVHPQEGSRFCASACADLRAHELARKALVQESEDLAVGWGQSVRESSLSYK